jgi:ankyrin repeat protein
MLIAGITVLTFVVSESPALEPPEGLIRVIKIGDLATAQKMLENAKGIDLNAPIDEFSRTLLHLAAGPYGNHPDSPAVCRALIEAGADKNAYAVDGMTPLSEAVRFSNYAVAEYLISAGVKLTHAGLAGRDSIFFAVKNNRVEFVRLLIKAGVDLNGWSAGAALTEAARKGYIPIMQELLSAGANVNSESPLGLTALHFWSDEGNHDIEALRLLIAGGANVNAQDRNGYTPLIIAIIPHKDIPKDRRMVVMKTFIAAGADLSIKNKWGDSAMDLGLKSKYPDVKKFFYSIVAQAGKK